MATVAVDDRSDLREALNRIYHRDRGNDDWGERVVWKHGDSSDYLHSVRNTGTNGLHSEWLHSGTAAPVTRINDAGLSADNATFINLAVTGNATLGDAAGDTLTVNATATFAAAATFNGNVTVGDAAADTLTVNATPAFKENATFEKNLTVQGNATLGNADTDDATVIGDLVVRNAASSAFPLVALAGSDQVLMGASTALTGTSASKLEVIGGRAYLAGSSEQTALALRYGPTTGNYFLGATNSADPSLILKDAGGTEIAAFGADTDTYQFHLTGIARVTSKLLVGATTDAFLTQGVIIAQGGEDNEILALKSSDVAHGMTTFIDTDTFGAFVKAGPTSGGVLLRCATSATIAAHIEANATTDNTTRSTSAAGHVMIAGWTKSGTTSTTPGADANILVVRSGSSAKFLVDAEGDVQYDGATGAGAWDDHEDVALLEALRIVTAPGVERNYRERFCADVQAHAETLARTGVLTLNPDGHHFVSTKALNGLLIDALRQTAGRVRALEFRLLALETP